MKRTNKQMKRERREGMKRRRKKPVLRDITILIMSKKIRMKKK